MVIPGAKLSHASSTSVILTKGRNDVRQPILSRPGSYLGSEHFTKSLGIVFRSGGVRSHSRHRRGKCGMFLTALLYSSNPKIFPEKFGAVIATDHWICYYLLTGL
jgi:hypothetical protein